MKEGEFDKLLVGITMCPLVRREVDIIKNHSEAGSEQRR